MTSQMKTLEQTLVLIVYLINITLLEMCELICSAQISGWEVAFDPQILLYEK